LQCNQKYVGGLQKVLIFVFSALIAVLDQFFKRWIVITHTVGEETVLIPGILSLFRLHNPGAAFGFLAGQPWWLLAGVQFIAAIVLVMIILRYTEGFWGIGLAAVLGGTIGNLIDRIFTFNADFPHHVVDMFRFTFIDFAIFNIADVFITMGFLVFLIHFIVITFKSDKNKAAPVSGYDPNFADYPQHNDRADRDRATHYPPTNSQQTTQPIYAGQTPIHHYEATQPTPVEPAQPVYREPAPSANFNSFSTDELVAIANSEAPVSEAFVVPELIPVPEIEVRPDIDLTSQVDPLSIFGAGLEPNAPSFIDPATHGHIPIVEALAATGPLPKIEIAPLLDHVYGGQYSAKSPDVTTTQIPAPASAPGSVSTPAHVPASAPAPVPASEASVISESPATVIQQAPVAPQTVVPSEIPIAPQHQVAAAPIPATPPVMQTTQPVMPSPPAQPSPPAPPAIPPAVETLPLTEAHIQAPIESGPGGHPETMLNALSALETELLGDASKDDYDVDKLLGEYGFESDEN
jgi:signal peptidase II